MIYLIYPFNFFLSNIQCILSKWTFDFGLFVFWAYHFCAGCLTSPPHLSEPIGVRTELRWRHALNALNGAEGQRSPKFCILTLSFSLKFLKISQIQPGKFFLKWTSQLTAQDFFKVTWAAANVFGLS